MRKKNVSFRIPEVGEDIYIPSSSWPPHAGPQYKGGLAKVARISEMEGDPFVAVEELPLSVEGYRGEGFNWRILSDRQEELRVMFGDQRAKKLSVPPFSIKP